MIYEKADPAQCLEDIMLFFDFYEINDIEELLWDLLSYSLASCDVDNWDAERRSNFLHFYRLLTKLIDGMYKLLLPIVENDK